MIRQWTAIGSVLVAGVFVGAVTGFGVASESPEQANAPKPAGAIGRAQFSKLPSQIVKELEERAESQRAAVQALERLLEAQRAELRKTESSLEAGRKFLAQMEDADGLNARRIEAGRARALKQLLPRERATQEYLDRLNARMPEGPEGSLDRRIHASELELTKNDLETIRAEIKAIQEGPVNDPRK